MFEAKKATQRRMKRRSFWDPIFSGKGVDVGCGEDLLVWPGADVQPFDREHGDANNLSDYVPHGSLNFVHASQCLEHMHDPVAAIKSWAKCVKKGGYLVVTVPDLTLYEKGLFPSRFNPDHHSTWSLFFEKSPCPCHQYVPDFVKKTGLNCLGMTLIDTDFDYSLMGETYDQTYYEPYAEAFIEMVFQVW